MLSWLCVVVAVVGTARGYSTGPPNTACGHMFPTGHGVNAMMTEPPFSLVVTGGPLNRTNQTFTVTLKVKSDPDIKYFEGMFVQARMASCYKPEKPLGRFYLAPSDNFSKVMNCHKERPQSAVAHKKTKHITDKIEFYWLSPNSMPGHIYFRATVVKNKTTFWTDVFSDIIQDTSDHAKIPTKHCEACQEKACTASSFAALTSLVVAAVSFSVFYT